LPLERTVPLPFPLRPLPFPPPLIKVRIRLHVLWQIAGRELIPCPWVPNAVAVENLARAVTSEHGENRFRHLISCAAIVWEFSELTKALSELQVVRWDVWLD
jgi:hypothetical protein